MEGNPLWVVGVSSRTEVKNRIIVHKVEQLPAPNSEADYDLACLKILPRAGNHTGFNQRHDAIGDELAMDAQILAVHEEGQHRVGDSPNARLQYCPVLYQTRHIAGYCYMHVSDDWLLEFAQRP